MKIIASCFHENKVRRKKAISTEHDTRGKGGSKNEKRIGAFAAKPEFVALGRKDKTLSC